MKKAGHSVCDSIICPFPFPMITIELQYTAEVLYAYTSHFITNLIKLIDIFFLHQDIVMRTPSPSTANLR